MNGQARKRVDLRVPYGDRTEAKAAGARWDPQARTWWIWDSPDDLSAVERWLPAPPYRLPPGPTVAVGLVGIPTSCYRCGCLSRPIAGIVVPEPLASIHPTSDGFLPFDLVAEPLSLLVDADVRAVVPCGHIRLRSSRIVREPYLSNGCPKCDTIFGNFPLHEDFITCCVEGLEPQQLVTAAVQLPETCLETMFDDL